MHLQPELILARAQRLLGDYLPRALVADSRAIRVSRWDVPPEPGAAGAGEPVSFAHMRERAVFSEAGRGEPWGAPWSTTWFRLEGEVPASWPEAAQGAGEAARRIELSVDLGFDDIKPGFQAEGLVRSAQGIAVKGLEPRNHHVPVDATAGQRFVYFAEAAGNPDFAGANDFKHPTAYAPTPMGTKETAGAVPLYRLGRIELQLIDETVELLIRELTVLTGLTAELPAATPRRAQLLVGLDRALDRLDPSAIAASAPAVREALGPLLASPADASSHRILATGHAHIDSAWLWPSRETVRKVTRTFANVLQLMDEDPEITFTCSSAQHFAWVKEGDPELYARVRERVREGRFIPVGNMWVESDVTMPSGESLARQLLYGARFFLEEFGRRSEVGWLPDSFGYPASLPQLLRQAGLRWFFTQKMCWNDANTMPHHTFTWEGTDGSRILTHFPPNNTYSGDMRPTELARSVRNFADHGGASASLMPIGYGDGGGGPTREMVRDARLQSDLEGSARVALGTPEEFFTQVQAEYADPPVWLGEMYLEFHRGIYTSQARTKRGNRRVEALLVEAELWCATAHLRAGVPYPYDELDELWRIALLAQFHDILPGTAIAWVHRETEAAHRRAGARLEELITGALQALAGSGTEDLAFNPAPFARHGLSAGGGGPSPEPSAGQELSATPEGGARLRSAALEIEVAPDGALTAVRDRRTGRNLVPEGRRTAVLQLHVDAPARWDAWDLDRAALRNPQDLAAEEVVMCEKQVTLRFRFGQSTAEQHIGLTADGAALRINTQVQWHERQRLLKLAFPLDLAADEASYETQFGHVRRPVHANTSWDEARYEVCAHRWVHVGEPGFGVAVVNAGTYGHDVSRESQNAHVTTTVRQSLLRAPTFPDPEADQGSHEFTTLLAPSPMPAEALRLGALLAAPLRRVTGEQAQEPLVELGEGTSAVLSAVKLAADRSGDLVVRLYEAAGARTHARLRLRLPVTSVRECDLTELGAVDVALDDAGEAHLVLRPFEVRTLRITLGESR
ncbi:alpha-mannosidase [Bogoriella caseilytica]|uniref:Alpha-mannosidase n=1 Tax=Bogoriella caseilytica TaxID=56055 RepID=A0A3N2BCZ7_9MICO|nr:glycoside hydrolase family 38 C-terminal domain-containing protein [Bogoriella caseilytica]ROR73127.1 alpha-mannosidase [Bogoriella caseilytica]